MLVVAVIPSASASVASADGAESADKTGIPHSGLQLTEPSKLIRGRRGDCSPDHCGYRSIKHKEEEEGGRKLV